MTRLATCRHPAGSVDPTCSRLSAGRHPCSGVSGQRGFTLIEVMAAFAVFTVLFGIVLQILSISISSTRRSGDFTQAALYAQSLLDVVGLEEPLEAGRLDGRFDDEFSWTLVVEPHEVLDERGLDPESMPVALFRVVLTVYWGENRRAREAQFETLRAVDLAWHERQSGRR